MRADRLRWETATRWVAVAAVVELGILRLATRTIINIPGLDVVSGPLSVVGALGRLAYFSTLVLLAATLVGLVAGFRPTRPTTLIAVGVLVAVAVATITGVGEGAAGWLSLVAVVCVAWPAVGSGWRGLPLVLVAGAFVVNGLAQVAQGAGGGLDGPTFAGLIMVGEVLALAALLLSPLLVGRRPSNRAMWAGAVVGVGVTVMMTAASSMTSILILWSFGLSAGLAPWAYGLAAGAVTVTLVAAFQRRDLTLAAAILLILAGGFALTSTYQTALLVVGLAIATLPSPSSPPESLQRDSEPHLELVL